MDGILCEHHNRLPIGDYHCQECENKMYKAKVLFRTTTKLGVVVDDSIYHVDYKHAERWVKRMGDKISDVTIIY